MSGAMRRFPMRRSSRPWPRWRWTRSWAPVGPTRPRQPRRGDCDGRASGRIALPAALDERASSGARVAQDIELIGVAHLGPIERAQLMLLGGVVQRQLK